MHSARAAVAPGVPSYLVTRPTPGDRDVDRVELRERLRRAVDEHRVCVLIAPAGYGKTSTLTSWVEHESRHGPGARPVAWLSLTESDRHPEHLARGLAAALAGLGTPSYDGADRRVLVVDDVHLAGDAAARAVLRPLVAHPPAGLRLVMAGRSDPGLGLSRLLASGDLAALTADDLSFTAAGVRDVARAAGLELDVGQATAIHRLTGGWPVAVRLALLSSVPAEHTVGALPGGRRQAAGTATAVPAGRAASGSAADAGAADAGAADAEHGGQVPHLPEYLLESVLGELPDELADFVLAACVCDWLTSTVADELLDRTDCADLLERAVAAGLPLERRESPGTEPVYRWHPLMAASGRALLQRQDPARLRGLERRAARARATQDPSAAAAHALRGRDPALAADLLRAHWLADVLRGDWAAVEELCARLPAPWSDDPEILAIRAACLRNAADADRAADLDRRARETAGEGTGPRMLDLTVALARLFVVDSGTELTAESARARTLLGELPGVAAPLRACALLLIGWTELRLRRPRVAIPLLREAAVACRAEGMDDLAGRAHANETFALAFGGDLRAALDRVAAAAPDQATARWRRADGAIEWFTQGWVQFWTGDATAAVDSFRRAAEQGGGLVSYADLARCWLTDAAVDADDRRAVDQAAELLDLVPDRTVQGLPWDVYAGVARAGAAWLAGRPDVTRALLDEVVTGDPQLPAANVLAAQLWWLCGKPERAVGLAATLHGDLPAYLRAGGVVVEALDALGHGQPDRAHELLEDALAASAPQGLVRPFLLRDDALTGLLAEHAAWGTRYPDLVTLCLTRRPVGGGNAGAELTGREREVLSRLSTTLSTAQIAAELHISVNTLKTHLRSVYRKLGVTGRREAVQAARRASVPISARRS